jgi:uncharacterized membrane protein YbhN (UPF0104 family)
MADDDDRLLDDHDVIEPLNEHNDHKSIESIEEWFIWSYLNVIMGAAIFGLIAIACSFRTNKFKQRENYSKANKWSHITFIVNFVTTLTGLSFFGYLIFIYFYNISIEQKMIIQAKTTLNLIQPK